MAKNVECVYDKDSFDLPLKAWETMRREIVEMLDLAGEGRYEELDPGNLILYKAGAFRMKLLYMYYPDQFLPIYSINHLYYFLKTFAVPAEKWGKKGVITANRVLWEFMRGDSRFKDWDHLVFMQVLCEYFPPNRGYWKIVP